MDRPICKYCSEAIEKPAPVMCVGCYEGAEMARDKLAAMAMQGLLAGGLFPDCEAAIGTLVRMAYKSADAMLAERERKGTGHA